VKFGKVAGAIAAFYAAVVTAFYLIVKYLIHQH
jgi:hypothetical protein